MTKKHFEALAYCMAMNEPQPTYSESHYGWEKAQEAIVQVCEKSNRLFDWNKFQQACHLDYWEGKEKPQLLRS